MKPKTLYLTLSIPVIYADPLPPMLRPMLMIPLCRVLS